jgi:hypothetical protein
LGNQIYCYAAARRLAWANNAELVLDHVTGFARDAEYQRKYRLDGFHIGARLATPGERYEPFERIRRGIVKKLNRFLPFGRRSYIEQEFPDFDPRLLDMKLQSASNVIDGLWQSVHYFADIEDILRADLRIQPPSDARNRDAQAWIERHGAVSVHVRWFSSPAGAADASTNVHARYYQSALSMLRERMQEPYFAVFSDDPHAAAAMLALPMERTLLVDWNTGDGGELADMWLMSSCKHYVVANSTFSWWGAWLGARQEDQLVLFPRCTPADALGWSWDYKGQMPAAWVPVAIVP